MEKIAHLGIAARSHYTGKCTMETVFVYLNKLWQMHGMIPADKVNIKTYHGSDLEPCCIEVMLAHTDPEDSKGKASVNHVFGDMRDRLDRETKHALDDIRPTKDWPADVRKQCFALMSDILDTNAEQICHPGLTSWCYRHQKQCRVFDLDDSDDDENLPTTVHIVEDSLPGPDSQDSCVMLCHRAVVDNRLKFLSGGLHGLRIVWRP